MSGPCLSSSVAGRPLRPATRHSLGEPLPHQLADRPRAHPKASDCSDFNIKESPLLVTYGINPPFGGLSRSFGQVAHVLLTLAPLSSICIATSATPFDLHVLSTPPAFVLSQNQTLQKKVCDTCGANRRCLPTIFLLQPALHSRTFKRQLHQTGVLQSPRCLILSVFHNEVSAGLVLFNFCHSKTRRVTHNSVFAVFCFISLLGFSTYHSARAESYLPQNRHWKLDSQRSHQENLSLAFAAFQRRVVKSTQPSLAVKKKVEETGGVLRMSFSFNRLRSEVFYKIRLAR